MFNIGQKIVCINDKQLNSFPVGELKKGGIYTVQKDLGYAVYLEEVKAPVTGHYNANRFRKTDKDYVKELLYKLEELKRMKLENENIEQPQNPQLNIGAVMRSYLPNIKILRKENFYTKELVKILRISLFGKVWFYHLTFKRFL